MSAISYSNAEYRDCLLSRSSWWNEVDAYRRISNLRAGLADSFSFFPSRDCLVEDNTESLTFVSYTLDRLQFYGVERVRYLLLLPFLDTVHHDTDRRQRGAVFQLKVSASLHGHHGMADEKHCSTNTTNNCLTSTTK